MEQLDFSCGSASRRNFIATLGAVSATALMPGLIGKAEAATKIRRIDMHHHFMPQHYMKEEHDRTAATHNLPPSAMMQWTAQQALDVLDKADVQFAVASISTPGVWYGDVALGRSLAREWNEEAAKTVHDHPTRFGFLHRSRCPTPREASRRSITRSARSRPMASTSSPTMRASGWAMPLSRP